MKNDIYDLLNDIDNQIDTFETVDITSTDLKNWKQSFALKKKTSVKKHTWKKYAAAAAAFIILLGGSSAPVRQNVYAQSQQIMESLSTLLGTKEDLSPYSTVVGKSISKNGITITLNEVILDGHSLIISYKTKIKDSSILKKSNIKTITELPIDIDLTIAGEPIVESVGICSTPIDKLTSISESEIQLNDSSILSEKADFTINFSTLDKSNTSIGKLKFAASGKELNAKTTNVALNHSFTLPNKTKITLKNYRSNVVNQQISFTISRNNTGLSGDIILKGKDDLGNPVEFYLDTADGTNGTFKVDRMTGYIPPKATCLTLTPYYNDFPLSSSVNSTEETAESTEKTVAESTEIEVSTTNTDDAQEISISNYKSLGKTFTITIH